MPTSPKKSNVVLKGPVSADDGLQGDERSLTAELAAEKAAKNAKDVYLQEAAHILADESGMLKADTRMASRAMPYLSMLKQNGN
jgi:carboxyl-terminal processing protease